LQKSKLRFNQWDDISRVTKSENEQRPNIILIAIESFSGDFLKAFGNKDNLTPNYDKVVNESIFFTNLYATGTELFAEWKRHYLFRQLRKQHCKKTDNQNLFLWLRFLKRKLSALLHLWWRWLF
jgi:glucan phosphoethanolaminetransferase (alkaline phosphatase superfamily)